MGNDLNFDELDKAVNNYMQKDPAAPTSPPVSPPAPVPPSPTPPSLSVAPKDEPTSSTAEESLPKPPPAQPVKIQIPTRQSLAGRRASRGTFHDIIPARPSPAKTFTTVAPVAVTPPVAPVSQDAEPAIVSENAPLSTPPSTVSAELPKIGESPLPVAPPKLSETSDAEAPEIVASSTEHKEVAPVFSEPDELSSAPTPVEVVKLPDEPTKEEPSTSFEDVVEEETPKILMEPEASSLSSSTLQKTPLTLANKLPDTTEAQGTDVGNGKPPESLASQQIDFADEPDKKTTTGLLETGELHAALPSNVPASPAQMDASIGEQQPLQVFDTKEYHTPITGGSVPETSQKSSHEKLWEWIIIALLVVVALIGGVVAYTMFVKG